MDPRIILAGRSPDLVGSLARGQAAGQQMLEFQRANELAHFLQASGGAVMGGDANALARYAALAGPEAALGIQGARLGMDSTRQAMEFAAQDQGWQGQQMGWAAEDRTIAERARITAEEQAALDAGMRELAVLRGRGDRAGFEAALGENGVPDGLLTWDNFDAVAARVAPTALEYLPAPVAPAAPVFEGGQWWDVAPGSVTPLTEAAPPEPADTYQRYVLEERAAGREPLSRIDFELAIDPPAAGTTVNVGAGETAFDKATGEALAAEAAEIVTQGASAQRALGQLATLEGALANAPQGAAGGIARLAVGFGIPFEGKSDVEVADAIISQMVPLQRPPGSGTMSDADLALFRQSLPSLLNSPEGNRRLVATLRAIAEYDVQRGNIARALQLREMTPGEAAQAYAALGNPIPEDLRGAAPASGSGFTPAAGAAPPVPPGLEFNGQPITQEAWESAWANMTPGERALWAD